MNETPAVPENPFSVPRAEGVTATFLSRALQLVIGEHETVKDDAFIAIVPPPVLAMSLADRPDHQADVLKAIGIPIDLNTTIRVLKPETVADIVGAALACEETAPGFVRQSVAFDDWPKIVSKHLLWKVVAHGDWHKGAWTAPEYEADGGPRFITGSDAAKCLVALLTLIDELKLISPKEKLEQLTVDRLITDLPVQLKDQVLKRGMSYGLTDGTALLPQSVFGIVKNAALVQYIRPEYLWEKVVYFAAARQDLPSEDEGEQAELPFRQETATDEVAPPDGEPKKTQIPPDPVLDQVMEAATADAPKPDTKGIFDADGAHSVAAPPIEESPENADAPSGDRPSTVPVGEDDIKPDEAKEPKPDDEPKMRSQPPPKPGKDGS
jgi:hypothetical protein